MTYEEFKEIIERTGEYQVSDIFGTTTMVHTEKYTLCHVSKTRPFGIDTIHSENEDFFKEHLDTIVEFAKTPIEDRYPVKKYYVKLDLSHILDEEKCYLNRHTVVNGNIEQWIGTKNEFVFEEETYQTQFTIEEIEEIIPKEDMDKFQIIPVEEEENGIVVLEKISFQNGARFEPGSKHGVTDQDLLEIVRDRLTGFIQGELPSKETEKALEHVEIALMYLNKRIEDRIDRQILGKYEK